LILVLFLKASSLIRMQGRCKPNAESSLFAEVQPVLANLLAKLQKILLPSKSFLYILRSFFQMLNELFWRVRSQVRCWLPVGEESIILLTTINHQSAKGFQPHQVRSHPLFLVGLRENAGRPKRKYCMPIEKRSLAIRET
jgi:hypothetical protein